MSSRTIGVNDNSPRKRRIVLQRLRKLHVVHELRGQSPRLLKLTCHVLDDFLTNRIITLCISLNANLNRNLSKVSDSELYIPVKELLNTSRRLGIQVGVVNNNVLSFLHRTNDNVILNLGYQILFVLGSNWKASNHLTNVITRHQNKLFPHDVLLCLGPRRLTRTGKTSGKEHVTHSSSLSIIPTEPRKILDSIRTTDQERHERYSQRHRSLPRIQPHDQSHNQNRSHDHM